MLPIGHVVPKVHFELYQKPSDNIFATSQNPQLQFDDASNLTKYLLN